MKVYFYYFAIFSLISCSQRDNNETKNIVVLPKTVTSINSGGNTVSEYQYNGTQIKAVVANNGFKTLFYYTNNYITKSLSYDSNGQVYSEINYEYSNSKLSKANFKIGYSEFNIFYTWIDANHVSFVDDKNKPADAIDKTDIYFNNGNIIKSTHHLYYPNNYTIDKVEIIESDSKNNPFKNIEGFSLINFDLTSNFFYQTNNITKIITTRTGNVNGQPLSESYSKTFQFSYNNRDFPQTYNISDSFGNSYKYEFSYFEN